MHSPVLDVVMMFDGPMMGLDFDRVGFFRHPRALVPLRGAHRSHRQLETVARFDVGCRGKRWNDEGDCGSGDHARGATKHNVHHERSRKVWIGHQVATTT
jgi:hypothetical protein